MRASYTGNSALGTGFVGCNAKMKAQNFAHDRAVARQATGALG